MAETIPRDRIDSLETDDILAAIRAVVDPACDVYEVHSSISALAGVRCKARKWAFLRAVKALVADGKTLIFPAFTFSYGSGAGFDIRTSLSETGVLADWVLEIEGARRTPNPIFSFAVIGPRTQAFLDADHRDAYGAKSVFAVLEALGGGALMLGAEWDYLSFLHHVEQRMAVPYRAFKRFHMPADLGDGLVDPDMEVYVRRADVATELDFAAAGRAAERGGMVRRAELGAAWVKFVKISDVSAICQREMSKNPCFLLKEGARVLKELDDRALREAQPPFRVALLGSQNLELLADEFKSTLAKFAPSRRFDVHTPAFGAMHREVMVQASALRRFDPDLTIVADTVESLYGGGDADDIDAASLLAHVDRWIETVLRWVTVSSGKVAVLRPAFASAPVSGDHANFERAALSRAIDARLEPLIETLRQAGGVLVDAATLAARCAGEISDPRAWYLARMPFSAAFSRLLAERLAGMAMDVAGLGIRLIVVDLDNTLWGGIAGDDGLEGISIGGDFPGNAFRDFQRALKTLSQRGVALAIASKNDQATVFGILNDHPEMILRRADFVDFEIHWDPKPASIARIIRRLNLSAHNVMFLDDNPTERAAVRQALPHVVVPELGDDPAGYRRALADAVQLNAARVTDSDQTRLASLHRMKEVAEAREAGVDHFDFIKHLKVAITVRPLGGANAARAEQLMMKTNQFNTTVRRHGCRELEHIRDHDGKVVVIEVQDRFSPAEIMGVAVLTHAETVLDSLVLSCRALGKGVEEGFLGHLARLAHHHRCAPLRVAFVETPRNYVARHILEKLHFEAGPGGFIATPRTLAASMPPLSIECLEELFQ